MARARATLKGAPLAAPPDAAASAAPSHVALRIWPCRRKSKARPSPASTCSATVLLTLRCARPCCHQKAAGRGSKRQEAGRGRASRDAIG